MDASALKFLSSYGMGLAGYLGNGRSGATQDVMNILAARYQSAGQVAESAGVGDVVSLSDEAKALLETTGGEDENTSLSGAQKGAQNFLIGFFDESGIDVSKLSGEAVTMIKGMQDIIAGTGATGRDIQTDMMEMRYAEGTKKVYTITGENRRMRIALEYGEDKKTPVKLAFSDISGGQVETAEITLAKDKKGVMQLNIERAQRVYLNGNLIDKADLPLLSIALYRK